MPKTGPFDLHSDQYEDWFVRNQFVFQSELNALRKIISSRGKGIEIGIGSDIFAEPLGIREFVDKDSPVGKNYLEYQQESVFYKDAHFYSTGGLINIPEETGLQIGEIYNRIREGQFCRDRSKEKTYQIDHHERK